MPGPGPHLMYAMGSGLALSSLTNGRFSPHHTLTYTINAFFGPDIGSFSEWLGSNLGSFADSLGSQLADYIHDPFFYIFLLGLPLCVFYSWLSKFLLQRRILDSVSGAPLSRQQCLSLVSAGCLSHFFLDHLFEEMATISAMGMGCGSQTPFDITEENGHSAMYTWILSTGWWKNRAPVNVDAVIVVGLLCTCLIGGFVYINRIKSSKYTTKRAHESLKLVLIVASLYCLWCFSQIYWINPRRPAVGEEADLGVLVFLATYFFFPHYLCIMSVNSKDHETELLPH